MIFTFWTINPELVKEVHIAVYMLREEGEKLPMVFYYVVSSGLPIPPWLPGVSFPGLYLSLGL